jgi:hypothetical protein
MEKFEKFMSPRQRPFTKAVTFCDFARFAGVLTERRSPYLPSESDRLVSEPLVGILYHINYVLFCDSAAAKGSARTDGFKRSQHGARFRAFPSELQGWKVSQGD